MSHRYTDRDVERALDRYRTLTGDSTARLERSHSGPSEARITAIYRVTDSKPELRGFEAYGAYSAWNALEMYCNGIEDERKRWEKPG